MKEKIQHFLELLPYMTKDEANFILEVLNWDDVTKCAFRLAKNMFEEEEND